MAETAEKEIELEANGEPVTKKSKIEEPKTDPKGDHKEETDGEPLNKKQKIEEKESTAEEVVPKQEETAQKAATTVTEKSEVKKPETKIDTDISELEAKIIHQIEYYFGDANLSRDKFLLERISNDESGWVPLSVLLTFKRLAAITTNVETIINAMEKSDEGLVEISEDKVKLRRHPERPIPELNEERRKDIMSRTAYAKGFPTDMDMSGIIDFFMPYEKIVNISMRKYLDKADKTYKFKGSVFVTFTDKEQAAEFINKEKVQYGDRELIRKWQAVYFEEKKEEKNNSKTKSKKSSAVEAKNSLPKGTVLRFEDASEKLTREAIREAVEKVDGEWDIAYIEYSKGDKAGNIRLAVENTAAKLLEKLENNKLKLSVEGEDVEITLQALDEEEEKVVLQKAMEHIKSRRNHSHRHKGAHHYGGRKRQGGHQNGEKKTKVAE